MGLLKDEVDNEYGLLVVRRRVMPNLGSTARWYCECECGGSITTTGNSLRKGLCISCGCERGKKKGDKLPQKSQYRTNRTGGVPNNRYRDKIRTVAEVNALLEGL